MPNYRSTEVAITAMPLYNFFQNLTISYPFISKITGLLILLAVSIFLNHLNTKYILIPGRTYLPSIIYIVIVCGILKYKCLYPALPATFFLLLALERLFDLYKIEKLSYNSFDAGLLISLASLFYFNIIFFIVFIWIVLALIHQTYWREWLYVIIGASVPYIFLFSIYYLSNHDPHLIYKAIRENFSFHNKITLSKLQYITIGYISILIILASAHLIRVYPSTKIFPRKLFNLFLIAFLISVAIFFSVPSASFEMIFIGAVPLSFLVSHYFLTTRKTKLIEFIFDLFIIIFVISQIFKF